MQPPPPLVSFYCQCGTPLSAPVGTPSVACHKCGTTMGVPVAAPPPPPQGYPPPPPPPAFESPRKGSGTVPFILAGVAGVAGLVVRGQASGLPSDKLMRNGGLGLLVLAAVLVAIGISRMSSR